MGQFIDLTGMQFGQLTVVSRAQNVRKDNRTTYVMWNCKCSCGKQTIVKANNLRSGNTKSCGCKNDIRKIPKKQAKDLRGMRFGKLVAHKNLGSFDGHMFWLCSCDCGEQVRVSSDHLLSGDTKSCGCLQRQLAQQRYTKEMKGQRFGMLTVLGRAGYIEDRVAWLCRCDCGRSKIIEGVRIRNGNCISCGCKKKSKGQLEIQKFLDNNNISYQSQYQFDDLRTNKGFCLRFDFAIFQSDKLLMLVQYNGIQHYKQMAGQFGKQQRQITDDMKRVYCKQNNIPLFIIRYDENLQAKLLQLLNVLHDNPVPSLEQRKV